jgi:hypothetical protein
MSRLRERKIRSAANLGTPHSESCKNLILVASWVNPSFTLDGRRVSQHARVFVHVRLTRFGVACVYAAPWRDMCAYPIVAAAH